MKIGEGFEKRDWGGPKSTWRRVRPALAKYPRGTNGSSLYAVRIASRKRAKRLAFGASP